MHVYILNGRYLYHEVKALLLGENRRTQGVQRPGNNMVVGQIQPTAMGLLRASSTARGLLAGDAKAREGGRW